MEDLKITYVEVNVRYENYESTSLWEFNDVDAARIYAGKEALRLIKETGVYWIKVNDDVVFDTRSWYKRLIERAGLFINGY